LLTYSSNGRKHSPHYCKARHNLQQIIQVTKTPSFLKNSANNDDTETCVEPILPPCYYNSGNNQWKQRIQLKDLEVGQKIVGWKISNTDLLNGRTGPKIFFECGVGRIGHKGKWEMVSGMLRVAKNYSKPKVVKKKIKRYTGKEVELYVRKIRLDEGRLEVCTSLELLEEEIKTEQATGFEHLSLSQLKAGEEVVGTVVDVRSYGVMVDIGANRNGLLHIQKVADLYMRYIKKEEGLIKAGLEKGAELRLAVSSIEKKRLFLDFTQDTKDFADKVREEEKEARKASLKLADEKYALEGQEDSTSESLDQPRAANPNEGDQQEYFDPYYNDDEAADWAAYNVYDDEAEDDGDEDRDIEDALGIGFY